MEIRAVDLGFASTAASVTSSSSSSLPQRQWHLELHDVSFAADAGEVLFCVGAAGSWGRSLLELLADRKTSGRRYGRVLYDGADVAGKMRRAAALVSDDGSLESLSVLRTLEVVTYAARLSGAADPAGRATAVLDKLRLGAVADTIVGNATIKSLSGGERKRLTIAVGLVAPRVRGLLLDEPTSGLDSATALEVMSHVRGAVAKGLGKTTVAYVQGASGALLARAADRLLVFVEGRLAFHGSAASAKTFFAAAPHGCAMAPGENVAELLVDVANRSRLGRDGAAHARAWEHRRQRERVRRRALAGQRGLPGAAGAALLRGLLPHGGAAHRRRPLLLRLRGALRRGFDRLRLLGDARGRGAARAGGAEHVLDALPVQPLLQRLQHPREPGQVVLPLGDADVLRAARVRRAAGERAPRRRLLRAVTRALNSLV